MRVLFPVAGTGVGGSVVSTADMVARLRESGLVVPIVLTPGTGPADLIFERAGTVPRPSYDAAGSGRLLIPDTGTFGGKVRALPTYLRIFRAAMKQIKKWDPDVIHLNEDRLVLPWGLAARRAGVPVVWHVRQEKPSKVLDALRLRFSGHLIFVADANRSRFAGYGSIPRSIRIYNSLRVDSFEPAPDSRSARQELGLDPEMVTIAFLGNLVERKRPEWLLRAASELQVHHAVQLVFIGELARSPDYALRLEQLAEMIRSPSRVHFLGLRDDVPSLLAASDILTLPSRYKGEAFPRAILEAMAASLPVVATDVAGVREAVEEGKSGLLVHHDDFKGYAASLAQLVEDGDLRRRLGDYGRRIAVERFSGAQMSDDLTSVYSYLLGRNVGETAWCSATE